MDEDTLYELRRMEELSFIEAFFLHHLDIPESFVARENYKIGDKYVIKLSNNDKKCEMTLEIDRNLYAIINDFVTGRDISTLKFEDIDKLIGNN